MRPEQPVPAQKDRCPANAPLDNPSNWPPSRAPVKKSKIRNRGWNNLFQPKRTDARPMSRLKIPSIGPLRFLL